jgi:hypothetical protein
VGNAASIFTTGAKTITVTNKGTLPATLKTFTANRSAAATAADTALISQTCVRLTVPGYGTQLTKLSDLPGSLNVGRVLKAGDSLSATIELFADGSNACPSLTDAAQGGSVTATFGATFTG